jgi:hypothetical protein
MVPEGSPSLTVGDNRHNDKRYDDYCDDNKANNDCDDDDDDSSSSNNNNNNNDNHFYNYKTSFKFASSFLGWTFWSLQSI